MPDAHEAAVVKCSYRGHRFSHCDCPWWRRAAAWWRRPWDRCALGHTMWTKQGYGLCRAHEERSA